jgi:hypothetical protein
MTNFAYSMVQIFQTEKGYRLSSQLLVAIFRIFPIHLVFPVFPSSSIATIYVFHIRVYSLKRDLLLLLTINFFDHEKNFLSFISLFLFIHF